MCMYEMCVYIMLSQDGKIEVDELLRYEEIMFAP